MNNLVRQFVALTTVTALVLTVPIVDNNQSSDVFLFLNESSIHCTTTSIRIHWSANATVAEASGYVIVHYRVTALSVGTGVLLTSPTLNYTDSEYTMPDLTVDSAYQVCVVAELQEAKPSKNLPAKTEKDCLDLRTIPFVRVDSVVVLLVTVLIIVLLIVSAYVCWRCAQKEEETPTTAEPGSEENGEDLEAGEPEEKPLLTADASDKAGNKSTSEPDPPNNVQGNEIATHDDV